jgi:hypothetical protein
VRRVSFSCLAFLDPFWAVPRVSCPILMFCAPGLIFGGIECVGSIFHVLRSRTHFRWYRVRRFQFSCFALPVSFSAVPWALGTVFMFCSPRLILVSTEGVGVRFMFCALRPVLGGIVGAGSRLLVFRSRTHFRQYRGRRVPFSYFALPDSFSTVPRMSCPVCMFCARGHYFDGTEGVRCCFQVLFSRTRFGRYRRRQILSFICCVSGLVFGGTEGIRSRFHVLRSWPRFRRYRGCRVPFTVLRSRTRIRQYRGRRVPFSCFTFPDPFWAVPGASGPVFMFCAPGIVVGGTEGVGTRFHVLGSRTRFRR